MAKCFLKASSHSVLFNIIYATVGRKKFLKKNFDQSQKFQDIHNFLH